MVADPTNTISATGADMDTLHFKNFVDAIRLGTPLTAPVSEGHKSVAMLQLGNIAWRTCRATIWTAATATSRTTPKPRNCGARRTRPVGNPRSDTHSAPS